MRKRIYVIICWILAQLLASCGHVAHRSEVEPGFNSTLLGGPALHTYNAPPPNYWESRRSPSWETRDFQWNMGYAWQLRNGNRLLAQAVFTRTSGDGDETDLLPSAGIYYQTKTGVTSRGMGLLLGFDPRFYFIWGRNYGQPGAVWRRGLDFSLGFGIWGAPVMPQLMYGVRYKNLQISALAEYRYFFLDTEVGVENSSLADNIRSRLFLGLAFTIDSYNATK